MQVKFRQTTRNGCGSLSIANIFDDDLFTVGLADCPGERFADLNKKLQDNGHTAIFIDPLFLTQSFFGPSHKLKPVHSSLFRYRYKGITKATRKEIAVPYLISIANSRGRNQHMVALVHSLSDNMFHVIDSTKDDILVINLEDLLQRFNIVSVSVFRLLDHPEPGNFVTMQKSDLPHIFSL